MKEDLGAGIGTLLYHIIIHTINGSSSFSVSLTQYGRDAGGSARGEWGHFRPANSQLVPGRCPHCKKIPN